MMGHDTSNPDRLQALLADRALCGLDVAESHELDAVLAQVDGEGDDDWGYELAVAALDEAMYGDEAADATLPAHLRERVLTSAVQWLAESKGLKIVAPEGTSGHGIRGDNGRSDSPSTSRVRGGPSARHLSAMPWIAAAACLLLALVGWLQVIPSRVSPSFQRERLIATATDVRTIAWADNDLGVHGDVVWSDDLQKGYMRFEGLSPNDPTREQYQLWIFDRSRSDAFPVDGGIFDIDRETGATVVPIDAKIPVSEATLFAVTIEPPGGVVVSDRERLILAAPVQGN